MMMMMRKVANPVEVILSEIRTIVSEFIHDTDVPVSGV